MDYLNQTCRCLKSLLSWNLQQLLSQLLRLKKLNYCDCYYCCYYNYCYSCSIIIALKSQGVLQHVDALLLERLDSNYSLIVYYWWIVLWVNLIWIDRLNLFDEDVVVIISLLLTQAWSDFHSNHHRHSERLPHSYCLKTSRYSWTFHAHLDFLRYSNCMNCSLSCSLWKAYCYNCWNSRHYVNYFLQSVLDSMSSPQ